MSLYANLLNPNAASATGTISGAPVVYSQNGTSGAQQDESAVSAAQKQINAGKIT